MALAIDHRAQLEKIADEAGAPRERIGVFKRLAVEAAAKVADGRPGYGMLLDGKYGREALFRAADHNFWIGRPVEEPGSRPLDFEFGGSLGAKLIEWPIGHTIKCLCFYHPDDPEELKARQERELSRLYDAARTIGRELLIEIIASKNGPVDDDTIARVIARLYGIGIKPDWWKLEGQATGAAWDADRRCDRGRRSAVPRHHGARPRSARGRSRRRVPDRARVRRSSRASRSARTIFVEPALAWFAGQIDDAEAVRGMADAFARLCALWQMPAMRPLSRSWRERVGVRAAPRREGPHPAASRHLLPRRREKG